MKHIKIVIYFFVIVILLNACQKEYSTEEGGLIVPTGTWQFNDDAQLFAGNMDSAYIDSSSSTKILHLVGTSLDGSQSFNMELYSTGSFATGAYKASLFQSTFQYTSGNNNIYQAGQLIGEFIVNVTSINNSQISGTFSGSAMNAANSTISLTNGKFTSGFNGQGNTTSVSTGVLGDSSSFCKPVILAGSYAQGVALTSANTIQVQVTVATAGTYSIKTNTVTGVTFSTTGTFTSTGIQSIILTGNGTPTNSGSQDFALSYGNSQCDFKINFAAPASGTLGGGGGDCTPFAISASTYQQGIALDASNTIQIQVNVATLGSYAISTNTVNGVLFSKTGVFTSTGVQTIFLTGSGTPVDAGAQNFTVTFGTSNCNFGITFLPAVASSGDYFPVTLNSNWTYGLTAGTTQDSIHLAALSYTPTFGSNTYSTLAQYDVPPSGATDSNYYRKPGGDYYQYLNYSDFFGFDQPVFGEYIFLKDNVASGTTWNSPDITGNLLGIPITVNIKMTIVAKAVSVTVGNFTFPDVIKMKYEYFVAGNPTVLGTAERWFASNVGEIHTSLTDGFTTITYDIGDYHIF